jgi:hypothetical protein
MAGSVPVAAGPIAAGGSRRRPVGVVIVQQRSLSQFFGHHAQSPCDGEIERRSRQRGADISLPAKKSDVCFFHWIAPFREAVRHFLYRAPFVQVERDLGRIRSVNLDLCA